MYPQSSDWDRPTCTIPDTQYDGFQRLSSIVSNAPNRIPRLRVVGRTLTRKHFVHALGLQRRSHVTLSGNFSSRLFKWTLRTMKPRVEKPRQSLWFSHGGRIGRPLCQPLCVCVALLPLLVIIWQLWMAMLCNCAEFPSTSSPAQQNRNLNLQALNHWPSVKVGGNADFWVASF